MNEAKALLARLLIEAGRKAPASAKPFLINGLTCGLLLPRSQKFLIDNSLRSHFVFTDKTVELRFRSESSEEISEELDIIAHKLRDKGFIRQWRDELLDVTETKQGQIVAKAERGIFRFFGMTTTCVHAVGFSGNQLWAAQRTLTKQVDPGLMDTLSGGLVAAGELPEEALVRETAEEAGLTVNIAQFETPCHFLVTRSVREGWMRERVIGYYLQTTEIPHGADGEVDHFELMTPTQAIAEISNNRFTLDAAICILKLL